MAPGSRNRSIQRVYHQLGMAKQSHFGPRRQTICFIWCSYADRARWLAYAARGIARGRSHPAAYWAGSGVTRRFTGLCFVREVPRNYGGAGEPAGNGSEDEMLPGETSSGSGPMIPPRPGALPPLSGRGGAWPQAAIARAVASGRYGCGRSLSCLGSGLYSMAFPLVSRCAGTRTACGWPIGARRRSWPLIVRAGRRHHYRPPK
jgi:hypothetical protein